MKIIFRTGLVFVLLTSLVHARGKFVDISDMPAKADFVIMGTVIDAVCRWDDRGVMIHTDYTIQVEVTIVGDTPSVVVMSFAGGSIGEVTIIVTETPVLEKGGKYILFSYEKEKYSVPVVGGEQGVFRVVYDSIRNEDFVVDYNWYQVEITNENQIIRGPLTELDSRGALTKREIVTQKMPVVSPKPVIRDASGQEIPQDFLGFKKRKLRKRGIQITKPGFIEYIRGRIHDKEGTK